MEAQRPSEGQSLITIICTTYAPEGPIGTATQAACYTALRSWERQLHNDDGIRLHVADDGSHGDYGTGLDHPPCTWWNGDVSFSRQERGGVGASLNAALRAAFKVSPLVLYLMDDWQASRQFDLSPWARLLMAHEEVGAVRVSPPHPFTGTAAMYEEGWALRLARQGFAFSLRPILMHERLFERYGLFVENAHVGDVEEFFNRNFCADTDGPEILYALPDFFQWIYHVEGYPRPSLAGATADTKIVPWQCTAGHQFDWPDTTTGGQPCPWVVAPSEALYENAICGKLASPL